MRKIAVLAAIFICFYHNIYAQDITNSELLEEIKKLKTTITEQGKRISDLEEKLSKQESTKDECESPPIGDMTLGEPDTHIDSHLLHRIPGYQIFDGLRIGAGATFIAQGAFNANGDDLSGPGENVADASYSIDLEIENKFKDFGMAFMHLETGDGAGVEDELKVFSNVNRDADDSDNSVSLTEVWYEHYFKKVPLTFTFGKIDPTAYVDNNEYANDETTQFLGRIFRNSPVIEFPDNSFGARLGLELVDFLNFEIIALDANSDWEDMFKDVFAALEVNFMPKLFGRSGNYRILAWVDDRDYVSWDNADKTKEKGYGLGLSFDQELTDSLGIFARYGWQDSKVYLTGSDFSLEYAYSLGLQFKGNLWKREEDALALAFGQVFPSTDYRKVNDLRAKSEKHLEIYYSYKINDHLTLSPDLQIIWDPYGGDAANGDKAIFVGGIRAQVDF